MPNLKTSIKDLRSTKRREVVNDRLRIRTKKSIKKFNTLLGDNNTDEAKATLKHLYKVLDKAAKKNVIKDNKADRLKGRLTKKLNKIAQNNVEAAKKST
jgi:small subunit ribosomal protein S20